MATLENITSQIEQLGVMSRFGTKKEVKHLPKIMTDGESIVAMASGLMGGNTWLLTCTNKRIIFLNKGMIYGLEQKEIPLSKVNSVEHKTGLMYGEVAIWDGASKMEVSKLFKQSARAFAAAVNKAMRIKTREPPRRKQARRERKTLRRNLKNSQRSKKKVSSHRMNSIRRRKNF